MPNREFMVYFTKKRRKMMDVLKKAGEPLSAQHIQKSIGDIDLVTVYRNLKHFVKRGMVQQVHTDSETILYEYVGEKPHHHAVCTSCDKMYHIDIAPAVMRKLLPRHLTAVQEVTIHGKCGRHT